MRAAVLLFLLAFSLHGQVEPEALQMIERSARALERFQSGEVETDNTAIYVRTSQPLTIKALLAWSAPGRVRLTIGSETAGETTISSGGTLIRYEKLPNQYSRENGAFPLTEAQARAFAGFFSVSPGDTDLITAKIVRDEAFSAGKTRFDCSVIAVQVGVASAAAARSYLLWIDKATGVPLKQQLKAIRQEAGKRIESDSTLVVRRLLLGGPVNDKLFEFDPPFGSRLAAPTAPGR